MNKFLRPMLAVSVSAMALIAVSCNEPEKKSASPGELPSQRIDQTPRINATTYFAHGHLLERQGGLERAVEQYRKAIELQPDFPTARNRLGIVLNKLGRNAEASIEFREAIRQKPNQAYLYNNLGFSLYLDGKYAEAEQAFQQAISLQPTFARANMNLGLTLGRQGRFDEALSAFRNAGDEVTAFYNLAVVQSEGGAYVDAVKSLGNALRLNPQYQPAVAYLHDISQLAADQEQAEQSRLSQMAATAPRSTTNSLDVTTGGSQDDDATTIVTDTTSGSNSSTVNSNISSDSSTSSDAQSSTETTTDAVETNSGATNNDAGSRANVAQIQNEPFSSKSNKTHPVEQSDTPDGTYDPACDGEQAVAVMGAEIDKAAEAAAQVIAASAPSNWPDGERRETAVAGAVAERSVTPRSTSRTTVDLLDDRQNLSWLLSTSDDDVTPAELAAKASVLIEAALQGRCAWSDIWCTLDSAVVSTTSAAQATPNTTD